MSDTSTGTAAPSAVPSATAGAGLVALGAAAGAVLRWALEVAAGDLALWSVVAINVVGAFVLGVLPAWRRIRTSPALGALLGPGFLGGFTTVSSWAGHTVRLVEDGAYATAAAYVVVTVVAAVAAAALGRRLAAGRLR
ncbi:MAG: fluoride efflux transporter FluC [Nocardioides sp.]|uniref:fluoride efflux transporter FluC n=1 Tax=Nocardioides sp. TaxID=35761 RepID=UPI003F0661C1